MLNLYGYRLLIAYLQKDNTAIIETKIDQKAYNDNELISIKTILNLPYYSSSPEFERSYGSINIDGIDYEYVKRRVYNDTLELLCLPNHDKTKLQAVTNELTKSTAGGSTSEPSKKATVIKLSLPDFFQQTTDDGTPASVILKSDYFPSQIKISAADFSLRQERPPQVNA
jgi:hypothetical protein